MPMNATDPKFLSTHIRRPRNIKRRFSAALALWCAWHKRGFAAGALALAPPHGFTHASRPSLGKGRGFPPLRCPRAMRGRAGGGFSANKPFQQKACRAQCNEAGAKGGRPKKAAAAAAVLQQPVAE